MRVITGVIVADDHGVFAAVKVNRPAEAGQTFIERSTALFQAKRQYSSPLPAPFTPSIATNRGKLKNQLFSLFARLLHVPLG
ncbi:hypothetical protein [Paenibacillus tyrfis]|uniref:hypothetical protein n=1 Tax=Paenibacillus tyrfis TaxID=1501230 RepID=UPI00209C9AF7|nr:hypothetical protein [Paenibacillus tyrfis]MCP1312583.1 hypothetical protein [Paenibacillus tyrfis]